MDFTLLELLPFLFVLVRLCKVFIYRDLMDTPVSGVVIRQHFERAAIGVANRVGIVEMTRI
jgi:hypothetical protein